MELMQILIVAIGLFLIYKIAQFGVGDWMNLIWYKYVIKPKENEDFPGYDVKTEMEFGFTYNRDLDQFAGQFIFDDGTETKLIGSYDKNNQDNPITIETDNDLIYQYYTQKQLEAMLLTVILTKEQKDFKEGDVSKHDFLGLPVKMETLESKEFTTENPISGENKIQ